MLKGQEEVMYTGKLIDLIMASVQRAEEHVQHDLELQEQALHLDPYRAYYFNPVAPATQKPARA